MRIEKWFFAVPLHGHKPVNVRDPAADELYVMGTLYGDPAVPDGTPVRTAAIEEFTASGIYTEDDILYDLGEPDPLWARDYPDSIRVLRAYQEELRSKGN